MARTFHWSIAWRLLRQQPYSSLRLVLVSALAVVIAFGAVWFFERSWCDLRERENGIVLSVVLSPEVPASGAYQSAADLRSVPAVAEVRVVTPEMWRREFMQRYNVEINDVVPENPFSYTVRVRMQQGAITAESFMQVYERCKGLPVSIEEITYPSEILRGVLETGASIAGRVAGVSVLAGLGIIVLLSSALRAARPFTRDDLNLLSMLGATTSFGLRSVMWRNLLTTIVGLGAGAALLMGLRSDIHSLWPLPVSVPMDMLVPASAGIVLICSVFITRVTLARS